MTNNRVISYKDLMQETVTLSMNHVHEGGIPFSALVVDQEGVVLGRGVNRVGAHHDPTAHAEVEAIRDACRTHKVSKLYGTTLLASGEPCAMCYLNALYAGVSKVLYAASREEAAAGGFDYRDGYQFFATDPRNWTSPQVGQLVTPDHLHPFTLFQDKHWK